MDLNKLVNSYLNNGYSRPLAISRVCQDVILAKISDSNFNRNVTIKGGVVMMAISKDKRRATQDLDIDFIRYSLENSSILEFIKKLNDNDIKINVTAPIKKLHHQDYDGKRVFIEISDNYGNVFSTKLDIGVHKDMDIKQDELCFNLGLNTLNVTLLANSKEQICVEKIKSLLKFGITSTRYKDVFDIYYLINVNNFDKIRFINYLDKFVFKDSLIDENNLSEIKNSLNNILSNNKFFFSFLQDVLAVFLFTQGGAKPCPRKTANRTSGRSIPPRFPGARETFASSSPAS